jgi:drug/metabolite transporter (DMT)-like permease
MVARPAPSSPITPDPADPLGSGEASMLASALSFSLMAVCVKVVGPRLPLAEVVLARSLVSLLISGWLVRRRGLRPLGSQPRLLLLRGLLGSLGLFCVFAALTRLPLAEATVIQYLHPTFTALLARPLLGERWGRLLPPALLTGWLGVVLIARPGLLDGGGTAPLPPLPLDGVLIALAGALLSALAYVSVRALAGREAPEVIVLSFPLVTVPLSLPLVLHDPVLPTAVELLWLLGVGVFTQLGQIGLTSGLAKLPAARATAISYAQVPFAGLWGWLLFGERIGAATFVGALLVLFGCGLSLAARPAAAEGR